MARAANQEFVASFEHRDGAGAVERAEAVAFAAVGEFDFDGGAAAHRRFTLCLLSEAVVNTSLELEPFASRPSSGRPLLRNEVTLLLKSP